MTAPVNCVLGGLMYRTIFENWGVGMKRCERVGCNRTATVVGHAQNAYWYFCDECAVDIVVRLTPRIPAAAALRDGEVTQ